MRTDGVVVTAPALDDDLCLFQCVEDLAVEKLITETTRSRRSDGSHRQRSGPAKPEHQPVTASQQSLPTCASSSALQSSSMSKDIPQAGPLLWGWISRLRVILDRVGQFYFSAYFRSAPKADLRRTCDSSFQSASSNCRLIRVGGPPQHLECATVLVIFGTGTWSL